MWAYTLTEPATFSRQAVPEPDFDDAVADRVLLRALAGGICGSDLPLFHGLPPLQAAAHAGAPGYPMHEIVGEVERSTAVGLAVGERVVGWVGGMDGLRERMVVGAEDVQAYDPALAPPTAVLLQPLACVLSALRPLRVKPPRTAAVLGLGPIGVLFAHVLKAWGVAEVVGVDRVNRCDVADEFGIDVCVQADARSWATGLTPNDRPQVVVEAVGHQVGTLADAVDAVATGGRILYFGIPDDVVYPFPMHRFLRKGATLWAGYTRDKQMALAEARAHLVDHPGLARSYVTDRFPVAQVQAAFNCAAVPAVGRLKVVVDMS